MLNRFGLTSTNTEETTILSTKYINKYAWSPCGVLFWLSSICC